MEKTKRELYLLLQQQNYKLMLEQIDKRNSIIVIYITICVALLAFSGSVKNNMGAYTLLAVYLVIAGAIVNLLLISLIRWQRKELLACQIK